MIQVFVTGGTFDKEYNYLTGELYFKDTHLKEMFDRGRSEVSDHRTASAVAAGAAGGCRTRGRLGAAGAGGPCGEGRGETTGDAGKVSRRG